MELEGLLPVHPYTGLTAIGVLPSGRPVWPVIGAAPDDDGGDDGDEDDGDDADSGGADDGEPGGGETGDGWTPPTKDEWDEIERRRLKANNEARRRRKDLDKLRAQIAELQAQKAAPPADGVDAAKIANDLAAATAKAESATTREKAAMRAAARQAIISAGYNAQRDGKLMASILGMVDLSELDVDDDGDVTGLDDEIEKIKAELPALFAEPEPEKAEKRRAPKADTSDKKPPETPETYEKKLARQMGLIR